LPETGDGRWLLILPTADLLLYLLRRDSETIQFIKDTVEELKDIYYINTSAITIDATGSAAKKITVNLPEIINSKHVSVTLNSMPPDNVMYSVYIDYSTGDINFRFINSTSGNINLPILTWSVLIIKEKLEPNT
jgi:uncharacterized protein YjgD (DUF1641 family)